MIGYITREKELIKQTGQFLSGGTNEIHNRGTEFMKWMIASDIHGSEYYCNELLEAYKERQTGYYCLETFYTILEMICPRAST